MRHTRTQPKGKHGDPQRKKRRRQKKKKGPYSTKEQVVEAMHIDIFGLKKKKNCNTSPSKNVYLLRT